MKQLYSSGWNAGRFLLSALLAASFGCDFTGPADEGVGIQNVTQSAPKLPEYDENDLYSPYYTTDDMSRPRYFHEFAISQSGFAIVFGGSDERGYSGIDTVEIFDQSTFEKDVVRPDSLAGLWIDTNFEGDPITFMNGARMLFTVNLLADGRLLCCGGSADLLAQTVQEKAEVFDPETRTFESLEDTMVKPRFRHSSVRLSDGSILLVGGQIQSTVTVINENVEEGNPGRQTQVTVFTTTPLSEYYSPTENAFIELTLPDTDRPARLNTPRGRAGHATAKIAGPDSILNSSDDVFVIAGGFQALSAQFAPRSKLPGAVGRGNADGILVIEFYDPQTRVFTQVSNLQLGGARVNDPFVLNLGYFNNYTIDGVLGMGNVALITHGNVDGTCPVTPLIDEHVVANYTGFGPAQGLQFFAVEDTQNGSHVQDIEYPPPPEGPGPGYIARCATNPVLLPRKMAVVSGVNPIETWVIAVAGCYVPGCPPGPIYGDHAAIRAGCVFDPFFSLPAVQLGLSPRDLISNRSKNNPTGVIGCWLTMDGALPTTDMSNYQTTPESRWARANGIQRVFGKNITLAGEDGIMNTPDDRILLAGGGIDYYGPGAEPTTPSAEICLPPGSTNTAATP